MPTVIHTNHKKSLYLLASIPILSNLLSVVPALATTSDSQNLSFSVVVSEVPFLQLTLETNNLSLDLTPKATSSDFKSSTFWTKVTTTNTAGYNLTMKASSSSLSNGTSTIPTIVDNSATYPNGKACTEDTATSTTTCPFDNNSWGYRLPEDTGYFAVPSGSSSKTIGSSTVPVDEEENSVVFAAKIDHTISAGTYNTNIEFQATANVTYICDAGKICYDDNGANSPTTMADQSGITAGSTPTLWASNFQRPGYGFLGWNTEANGKGAMYGPNETITDTDLANSIALSSGLELYAIWLKASDKYTMQTFNDTICQTEMVQTAYDGNGKPDMNQTNNVIALRDERDNNVYAVAKLADNKCWMIENLRLDNTATLSSTNTNVPANWMGMAPNYGESSVMHLAAPGTSSEYWCTDGDEECLNQSRLNTINTAMPASTYSGESTQNNYSFGNYYNWYSATAGYGTYSIGGTDNANIDNSICPSDWKLPTGGDSGSTNLATTDSYMISTTVMGGISPNKANQENFPYYDNSTKSALAAYAGKNASESLRTYPANFVFSGSQGGGNVNWRTTGGRYWTATASIATEANSYHIVYSNHDLYPGTFSNSKYYGFPVRCLAR